MVVALTKTLFTALVFLEAQDTQGALHGKTTQSAWPDQTTQSGIFLAKPDHKLKGTIFNTSTGRSFWLNLEKREKVQRHQKLRDARYFLRVNLEKHLKTFSPIKLSKAKKSKKSKKSKIYRPNNRSAELTANQGKPFYEHMTALSKNLGLVGNATYGLAFHLGRHTKEECGVRWEEGCRLAVACYNTLEEGGCCQQWDGNMDLTGACEPCGEALGYCDECYYDSPCGHFEEKEEEHHDLKDDFTMMDMDRSGDLSRDEIKEWADGKMSETELDKFMKDADKDENGLIDYEEFKMHAHAQEDEKDEELWDHFKMADTDGSEGIDTREMRKLLAMHEPEASETELDSNVKIVMHKGDNDENGVIDFEEFKQLVHEHHEEHEDHERHEAEMKHFFEMIDADKSGSLDRGEVKQFSEDFGEELDEHELDEIMTEADKDGNGLIDFEEFKVAHEEGDHDKHEEHEDHDEWAEDVHHEDWHEDCGDPRRCQREHVGDWEEYDELEEEGMDPSAVSNPCGEKWDHGCSDAWVCYQETVDQGCCDSRQDPPEFFRSNECAACATAKGLCDDCFPESPCGGPPPDPPAPPTYYWTTVGHTKKWTKHSSGEKHPECLADSSTTSAGSNKYGNDLGVVCCDASGTGSRPGCKKAATYEQALSHCEERSLRLCSKKEIENGAGKGTGCSFDAYLLWTSTPCDVAKDVASGGDNCLIADPDWECVGSQCIPAEDYDLYTAEGGAWCLKADHKLCQATDASWCAGECQCPGNCPHACGRCPASPAAKLSMLSAHSAFTVSRHNNNEPSDTNYGDPACACIGIDDVEGKRMVRLDDRTTAAYPVDLGASCQAWDDGRSFLGCKSGQDPGQGNGWCAQKWCYVDPCKCDIGTLPKTSYYLPGASIQGKPIYYSYATCGGKDTYTVDRKEACVNQMTEGECDAFPKCGWHEGRCMGKDLVGTCQKRLHGFTWGRSNCRCIGVANLLGSLVVNVGGKRKGKFPTKVTKYPADVGATCQAWDNSRHPDCQNKVKTLRPDWCEQKWCYVDPCSCDLPIPPKTSKYVPDAVFQGRPIYYSYHACGSEDTWTAEHHETACVNQKSEKDCDKLSKCAWTTNKKCVGKELAGMCPGMDVEEEKKVKSSAYASTLSFVLLLTVFGQ